MTTTAHPHYAEGDEECAECGHLGQGQVPDCRCGEGTDSVCDPQ